ncbi:DUF2157 domain-containing protein [Planctomycetes bacterium TBK1r]|uniref:DUF2157 domain-containing protein n=1 Tax=Stieleria magnilauensis TaxID=2527963 RepID=A0ABX5Y303_9BACT|nr:hypothetical protein TBK1r_71770 [Planctomycetes bacterium TBK1r]
MAKRCISENQRVWLVGQLDDWQLQGVLSADQADRILDLYETQAELSERKRSTALLTLMGVAALLVGLGALLLIGYNWNAMPDVLKLLLIFGMIVGTQGAGFVLRFNRHATLLSEVVFFLGCLFYGAGIFLTAQIFHLNAHYPDGVWWWAVGVLPFALCLDTLLVHTLLVALLAIWCGMEIIRFGEIGLWFFGRWGGIPNGAYSLPLLAFPGLMWAYRKGSVATVALYVPLLAWWIILQPIAWDMEEETVYFIGAVGGLMLVIAESHSSGAPFAIPYRLFGVLLAAGVLLAMSFHEFNEEIQRSAFDARSGVLALVIVMLSMAIISVTAVFKRHQSPEKLSVVSQIGQIVRRQWLPIGLVLLMVMLQLWHLLIGEPILPTIVANIAMLFLAVWLVGVGLREDRGQPFAAGVLYFLLWAVVRYVDLFGDFGGMLGAAVMFFLCGGALFGVAFYWRQRRRPQHD